MKKIYFLLIIPFVLGSCSSRYTTVSLSKIDKERKEIAQNFVETFLEKCQNKDYSEFEGFNIAKKFQAKLAPDSLKKTCNYINYKNGKDAVTHYKVLERFGNATYIECRLETGRTHQIRVHMTSLGHPLLGDEIYGSGKNPYHLQGQTLHAMVLGFVHPRTGEYMEFSAPLPEYFLDLLEKLRK